MTSSILERDGEAKEGHGVSGGSCNASMRRIGDDTGSLVRSVHRGIEQGMD